jgi:hypothetical protein
VACLVWRFGCEQPWRFGREGDSKALSPVSFPHFQNSRLPFPGSWRILAVALEWDYPFGEGPPGHPVVIRFFAACQAKRLGLWFCRD